MQALHAVGGWFKACTNDIGRKALPVNVQEKLGILTQKEIDQGVTKVARFDLLERMSNAAASGFSFMTITLTAVSFLPKSAVKLGARMLSAPIAGGISVSNIASNCKASMRVLYAAIAAVALFALTIARPEQLAVLAKISPVWYLAASAVAFAGSLAFEALKNNAATDIAKERNGGYVPADLTKALEGQYNWQGLFRATAAA